MGREIWDWSEVERSNEKFSSSGRGLIPISWFPFGRLCVQLQNGYTEGLD